jgi:sulfane dehydrogenase subunit SoxC
MSSRRRRHGVPVLDFVAGNGLINRRALLGNGITIAGGLTAAGTVTAAAAEPLTDAPWSLAVGETLPAVQTPSAFEKDVTRALTNPNGEFRTSHARTPHQRLGGTITPNGLHFSINHGGIPNIDPAAHKLVIHGMVRQPLEFTLESLSRYPLVTRMAFVECAGNSAPMFAKEPLQTTVQMLHGLVSNAEWTGVPLSVLLDEAGVDPAAKWLIAEGADAQFLDRSVPVKKAYDDALIAIYQNGEHLMPGNGYPMRLLLPGYQGNMNVKYLRRIKVINQPAYSYFETKNYSQILPGGKTWRFHFLMEVKSFITHPSFGQSIKRPGLYAISGLAYSGTGRISKVIVSADGGKLGRSGPARTDSRQGVHAVCQDSISARTREILLQRRGVAVPMFPGSESREAPGKQFSGVVRAWNFRARNVCASRVAAISAFPAALSDRAF